MGTTVPSPACGDDPGSRPVNRAAHQPAATGRAGRLLLWVAALVLLFTSLGARQLWKSEARWAEVTRGMLITGDLFKPTLNGDVYFDKPLLGYWLIAALAKVTGTLNEWIVRLPSALAGLLALWATVRLGRRLWSDAVGLTAGWILLTTYGFLFYTRLGMADMENLAAIMLALVWYWGHRMKPRFLSYLVFYVICFVGAQTKGLAAVAVPLVAIVPDLLRERRWRAQFNWSHVFAIVLGAGAYIVPFLFANLPEGSGTGSGLWLVIRENIIRYFRAFDHQEPWYCYFYHLPILFAPWTLLLFFAIAWAVRALRTLESQTQWLAEAMVLVFLFFTLSGSRRSYYILPLLPMCALLCAVALTGRRHDRERRVATEVQKWIAICACAISIVSPIAWIALSGRLGFTPPPLLVWAAPVIGLLAAVPLIIGRKYPERRATSVTRTLVPVVASTTILVGSFFCVQHVSLDFLNGEKAFATGLREWVRLHGAGPEDVAYYREIPDSIFFYLDFPRPIQRLWSKETIKAFLDEGSESRILVVQRQYLKTVRAAGLPADLEPSLRQWAPAFQMNQSDVLLAYVLAPDRSRPRTATSNAGP